MSTGHLRRCKPLPTVHNSTGSDRMRLTGFVLEK